MISMPLRFMRLNARVMCPSVSVMRRRRTVPSSNRRQRDFLSRRDANATGSPNAEILWYNLRRFCGELTVFIYEEQNWPTFRWDASHLESALARTAFHEGQLLGRLQDIGFETQRQASCVIAAQEIVASHAIEGEQLDAESVRSSVARHLDLAVASPERGDHRSDALAEMLLDATQKAPNP